MKKGIKLKQILKLGGQISFFENGGTNFVSLSKIIKERNLPVKEGDTLVFLIYQNTPQIQAIFRVKDLNNEEEIVEEIFNKLNEL